MENLNINSFLNKRKKIEDDIINILNNFNSNCDKLDYKKGIYIYGAPGCGKTYFISEILKKLNYDMIKYDKIGSSYDVLGCQDLCPGTI